MTRMKFMAIMHVYKSPMFVEIYYCDKQTKRIIQNGRDLFKILNNMIIDVIKLGILKTFPYFIFCKKWTNEVGRIFFV